MRHYQTQLDQTVVEMAVVMPTQMTGGQAAARTSTEMPTTFHWPETSC